MKRDWKEDEKGDEDEDECILYLVDWVDSFDRLVGRSVRLRIWRTRQGRAGQGEKRGRNKKDLCSRVKQLLTGGLKSSSIKMPHTRT